MAGAGTIAVRSPKAGRSASVVVDTGWYVQDFHAVLLLDRSTPEAIERRSIVAEQDGLDFIDVLITLPREPTGRASSHDLLMEVLYGAALIGKERDTGDRFRFRLGLPAPLHVGESHEYGLLFRIPPGQPMRTHYVFTPMRRCDLFDLRVRFNANNRPAAVWRVNDAFHRAVDDIHPTGEVVLLDAAGEIHLQFRGLRTGFGYGAQWLTSSAGPSERGSGSGRAGSAVNLLGLSSTSGNQTNGSAGRYAHIATKGGAVHGAVL
jgi:hypothetical protein